MTELLLRYVRENADGFDATAERCRNSAEYREEMIRDSLKRLQATPPETWCCRLERANYVCIFKLDYRGVKSCGYKDLFGFNLVPVEHQYGEPAPSVALRLELLVDFGPIGGFGGTAAHIVCKSHEERMKLAEALRQRGLVHAFGTDLKICALELADFHVAWDINPDRAGQRLVPLSELDNFVGRARQKHDRLIAVQTE